ncbi:unnamed protein product, partial [Ectocarpus sp. 4 AP-2014]
LEAWVLLRRKSLHFIMFCTRAHSLCTQGGESNRTPNPQTCWLAGQNRGGVYGSDEQEKEEHAIARHVVLPSLRSSPTSTRHREATNTNTTAHSSLSKRIHEYNLRKKPA